MTPDSPLAAPPRFESPAQLAGIGLCVWLAGVLIHPLAILTWLGLGLVLVAGVAYLLRPRTRTMYWRGGRPSCGALVLRAGPGGGARCGRRGLG